MVSGAAVRTRPRARTRATSSPGTSRSSPSMRARPPRARPSTLVLAVPGWSRRRHRRPAPGDPHQAGAASRAARQSVGTTSKPVPGITTTPSWRARACALVAVLEYGDLAGDVEVAHVRGQAGVEHRADRGRETARRFTTSTRLPSRLRDFVRPLQAEYATVRPSSCASASSVAVAPRQHGLEALAHGFMGDQLAGVAIGTVQQQRVMRRASGRRWWR